MEHLKRAEVQRSGRRADPSVQSTVNEMLAKIRTSGEAAIREYAKELDGWEGDFVLSETKKRRPIDSVPRTVREDIRFSHRQIRRFAEAQRDSLREFEIETEAGVRLSQIVLPVQSAGCYVPGGRYAHAASALMSIATAKAAGVPYVVACSPPRGDAIDATVAYAMDIAGADTILELGGVQAIAAMAFGHYCQSAVDILVGPGNALVAEAKRLLFGEVGIDVVAGPTESAIIADANADPMTIAVDLVSQAEHGTDSPVWLFTDDRVLAATVLAIVPRVIADMPNSEVCEAAWRDFGEVILCDDRDELVAVSDDYACEHLQVMASDLEWWKDKLRNYGSLFLGEGSTVSHGDKCSGTNHILPTNRAARYTGGLNAQKFVRILTSQELDEEANLTFSAAASRISRCEGMEGHARACDWRLRKYFPDREWDFPVYEQVDYTKANGK